MAKVKIRLDQCLVARGLVESRTRAQALIMAGHVTVDGSAVTKTGHSVHEDCLIHVAEIDPRVGRGYQKIDWALAHFGVAAQGRVACDIGSSTGGFTQCLLDRGARSVHAVDSGSHQLHEKLRQDPRVHVHEKTNARHLSPDFLDPRPDLAVMDVSFIATPKIWPALKALLPAPGELVSLVKPQFEAEPGEVGRGGVVHGFDRHGAILTRWFEALAPLGGIVTHFAPSPILGGKAGNVEYLARVLFQPNPGTAALPMEEILEVIRTVVPRELSDHS